jgi:hypothetical protein
LRSETSTSVDDLNVKLSSTFEESDTLLGGDVMGDFSGIRTVVHQQEVELTDVGNDELTETVGQEVTGLLGGTITNLGHRGLTLETSTHVTIDTLGLSPRFLLLYIFSLLVFFLSSLLQVSTYTNTHETVRLVTLEGSGTLLDNVMLDSRSDHCLLYKERFYLIHCTCFKLFI